MINLNIYVQEFFHQELKFPQNNSENDVAADYIFGTKKARRQYSFMIRNLVGMY